MKCLGFYNDCTCGCTRPKVGDAIRPRDVASGMTIMSTRDYRASRDMLMVVPSQHVIVDVTYRVEYTPSGTTYVVWDYVNDRGHTITSFDSDERIWSVVSDDSN